MIYNDTTIRQQFHEIIPNPDHRDEALINPASFDVRIGNEIRVEAKPHPEIHNLPLHQLTSEEALIDRPVAFPQIHRLEGKVFWLEPGEIILASMLEEIHTPHDAAMAFYLKSSRAREGYEHVNAGWIDPGWKGILTMEIKNNCRYNFLPIFTGLRIGQLVTHTLVGIAENPYMGRYLHAKSVEAAKTREYDLR